jgi:magnesium transporter
MKDETEISKPRFLRTYFLSEILGNRAMINGKRNGNLADIAIQDGDVAAEVTHVYITRAFGAPSLLIPWEKVKSLDVHEVIIDVDTLDKYEEEPGDDMILVKDKVLDKKILDTDGREVEVVYDVALSMIKKRLLVSGVDVSRYALLRRIGFKWLSNLVYNLAKRLRNETIPWSYVQALPTQISSFKGDVQLNVLKDKLEDMHPVDLADILEDLDHNQRVALFRQLNNETASDALEEIDPSVQRHILASLTKKKIAMLVDEMTPGQAADILAVLPSGEVKKILRLVNEETREKVHSILEKHEEKILNYSSTNLLKFLPNTSVREAHQQYRSVAQISDVVMYLYVTDKNNKLLGVIDIRELMKADDSGLLKDIMVETVHTLTTESTLREASEMFMRYSFRALPIVDENDILLGAVSYRDMVNLKHRFLE